MHRKIPGMITLPRIVVPLLLAATVPLAAATAQAQSEHQPPSAHARLSADAIGRLQDGRFAMIRESLKLNEAQLKLWSPVEAELRSAAAARKQLREERMKRREQGAAGPNLPDRLELASRRLAERAQHLKTFSEAFRPFYASLSEEQKAIADVVFRHMRGGHRGWQSRRASAAR